MQRIGRWEVVGELGRGGAGVVYRVRDAVSGEPAALKLLLTGREADLTARRRFQRELEAVGRLDHPGVVRVRDAGEREGAPWIALELVEGESLEAHLGRTGPLPPADVVRLGAALARALAHCHARGVLHRDLKPDNVLLRWRDGAPLLTDFGLARALEPDEGANLTRTGRLLGTPLYWSPEQAAGRRDQVGPATDVYGLGGVLYALLTGGPPHGGDSIQAVLASVERGVEPPSRRRPGLPPALDALVMRCLAQAPASRPTAAELAGALEGLAPRAAAPRARGPRTLFVGVGLGLVVGALGVWGLGGGGGLPTPAPAVAAEASAVAEPPAPPQRSEATPADVPTLLAQAETAWRRHRHAEALARCADVLARGGPDEREAAHMVRSLVLLEQGAPNREVERELGLVLECGGARRGLARGVLLLFTGGDLREGLALVEAAAVGPDPLASFILGRSLELAGDDVRAVAAYTRALELAPDDFANGHYARAGARWGAGDRAGALADFDRALELEPGLGECYMQRGRARSTAGEHALALADLDRAVLLEPDDSEAWLVRAHVRRQAGDLPGAHADYTRVTELAPGRSAGHLGRGLTRPAHDVEAALADFTRALELDPDEPEALYQRARIGRDRGDVARALSDLDRLARSNPTAAVFDLRGQVHTLGGNVREAIADHTRALELEERASTRNNRGFARQRLGDTRGALEDYERALELDPGFGLALANRARALAALGDVARALPATERALAAFPPGTTEHALLQRTLADLRARAR